MKIVILVKRVLDTASIIKIGADNKSIIEMMNMRLKRL